MKDDKSVIVLDTDLTKITDLGNDTSDVLIKESGELINIPNHELLLIIREVNKENSVTAYKHKN